VVAVSDKVVAVTLSKFDCCGVNSFLKDLTLWRFSSLPRW
jgi:hypothetical protein